MHATQIKVETTFCLSGEFPDEVNTILVEAVESVPRKSFFDEAGLPSKKEVREIDTWIAKTLTSHAREVSTEYCPFTDCRFNVDIAVPEYKLLVEVEKGKLPRIELDILKIVSACTQMPNRWEYGALIVPASYITLALAGRQTPSAYLRRLSPLVKPILQHTPVKGILVIGYTDPRVPM